MNAIEAVAIGEFPELVHLVAVRDAGWRFVPPHVENGHPVQLDGCRWWPGGWVDSIHIRAASEVLGLRIDAREPPVIVWERRGGLAEVVQELLALPMPDDRLAPQLVIGRAPTLWTP